ncbi:MAG TPA: fibronectin type III domain-containing protein, partial [Mycobacterium sp.]|nr:fibronectin type III domain-containing protein [Mycobacterium sp.]
MSIPQAHAAIAYVQKNYAVPQSPQAQVTVPFTAAQTVGNLNVVVIGWNDATSHVVSVSDTRGNAYSAALSPTVQPGIHTQVIYYAAGIGASAAGANTVTVNFDAAVSYPDVRIAEYGGISATTPVDAAAGASGTGTTSSVTLTTTNANDLLVAGNYVQTSTTAAGAGYTNRVITAPDGNILEDRTVTVAGAYSATASLSGSGGWVMQLVTFRAAGAGGDTQPPTAPNGLTATGVSSSQINLAWTASTDNVGVTAYLIERCQGSGCTSFAQVGTSTSTGYSDTALAASTTYLYRVRATDAAGNTSGYSATASATTNAAVSPPSAPTGLTATATSSTQISLSWTASTGTLTVTGYRIERCPGSGCTSFVQIGTSTSTAYADTNLTPASTYVYRVRATDSGGNLSAYSATASATTSADTQPPTAPGGITASAISSSQINLAWTAATDNVGVTGYRIESCVGAGCTNFAQIGTSASTSFSATGLTAATTYLYRVRATDAAGNLSSYSGTASATTAATSPTLAYVQSASATPQTPQAAVSATFGAAQTVGNTIVVFVGWYNTTSAVQSVADTAGNSYQLISGPATDPSAGTQAVYYATNIHAAAASTNRVTVTFTAAAPYPDLRVAEYAGVDVGNPVDGGIEGTGSGIMSVAGPLPTAWPYDLLVAGNYVTSQTAGAGAGFTRRLITSPDGSILEDRIVSATGSYSATAPLTVSGSWIMQLLALRGASPSSPDTTPPVVSISAPAAGAVLSGTVAISVSATDPDSRVAGVQLKIDGLNVGIPDTTTPFTISFDTSQLPNGTHTLSAYAWDPSRNIGTSQPVSVTFNNS